MPSHSIWLSGHRWQVPNTQLSSSGHRLPQVPQLFGSKSKSTQVPPQLVWLSVGHRQVPLLQDVPPAQILPQAPQLFGSLLKKTHEPRQLDCPACGQPCSPTGTRPRPEGGAAQATPGMEKRTAPIRAFPIHLSICGLDTMPVASSLARLSNERSLAVFACSCASLPRCLAVIPYLPSNPLLNNPRQSITVTLGGLVPQEKRRRTFVGGLEERVKDGNLI